MLPGEDSLFGGVEGRSLVGRMLFSLNIAPVFYHSERKDSESWNALYTNLKVSGKEKKAKNRRKTVNNIELLCKVTQSTCLTFWNKCCSILSFQQATLNSNYPPLFRKEKKKLKSPGLNKQKTQSACRLNLKQMVKLLQKCNHFWKKREKAPAPVQLLFPSF